MTTALLPELEAMSEDVASVHGMVVEEGGGQPGQSLEGRAQRGARVQHQPLEQDGPHPHEAPGTVVQLFREHVGVPGPEDVDGGAAGQCVRDERRAGLDPRATPRFEPAVSSTAARR